MIQLNTVPWLVQLLHSDIQQLGAHGGTPGPHNMELFTDASGVSHGCSSTRMYGCGLLLNLVLQPAGKVAAARSCGQQLLAVCEQLVEEQDDQVRAYVNGILYAVLELPAMAAAAAARGAPAKLKQLEQTSPPVFARQLYLVQQQLHCNLASVPQDIYSRNSSNSSDEDAAEQGAPPDPMCLAEQDGSSAELPPALLALLPTDDACLCQEGLPGEGCMNDDEEHFAAGASGEEDCDAGTWQRQQQQLADQQDNELKHVLEQLQALQVTSGPAVPATTGAAKARTCSITGCANDGLLELPAAAINGTWSGELLLDRCFAATAARVRSCDDAAHQLPVLSIATVGVRLAAVTTDDWVIGPIPGWQMHHGQMLAAGSPGAAAVSQLQSLRARVVNEAEAGAARLKGKMGMAGPARHVVGFHQLLPSGVLVTGSPPVASALAEGYKDIVQPRRALDRSPR
eukprot:gene13788-13909_t